MIGIDRVSGNRTALVVAKNPLIRSCRQIDIRARVGELDPQRGTATDPVGREIGYWLSRLDEHHRADFVATMAFFKNQLYVVKAGARVGMRIRMRRANRKPIPEVPCADGVAHHAFVLYQDGSLGIYLMIGACPERSLQLWLLRYMSAFLSSCTFAIGKIDGSQFG